MLAPLKLGIVKLKNNLCIAPLAGVSDLTFRQLMLSAGAGLVVTEMISTAGLSRRDKKTIQLMRLGKKEHPVALQLFGNKPDEFLKSIEYLNEYGSADLIDINMGCPVRKVINGGSGSALMKNLKLAQEIINVTTKTANFPVMVKFRLGWDDKNINYLELGKICAGEGVAAVTLHARTRAQAYSGKADWSAIAKLKSAVKIPVIGNGDVKTPADFIEIQKQTGCDGVMIGRASMGNPWLIKSIATGKDYIPTQTERIGMYLEHVRKMLKDNPEWKEYSLLCYMRKFAHRYINGFDGAAHLRQEINKIKTLAGLEALLA